jgi:hypothetical protein
VANVSLGVSVSALAAAIWFFVTRPSRPVMTAFSPTF